MNERINNRADRLTAEVVEKAKGVNYKTDGYSWNKFSNWLRELLRKEFLDQELEVFAEESEKLECVRGQLPLVVYFRTDAAREEFIQAFESKIGVKAFKL